MSRNVKVKNLTYKNGDAIVQTAAHPPGSTFTGMHVIFSNLLPQKSTTVPFTSVRIFISAEF
jgi:hypothetical protein